MSNARMMDRQMQAWAAIVSELKRRVAAGPRGTVTRLATLLDTTRGTVSRWLAGSLKGERVPYDRLLFLLERLEIDPETFFGKRPEMDSATEIPLIGLAACGYDWCTAERLDMTATQPSPHLAPHSAHSPHSADASEMSSLFAVMAIGESMRPAGIEPGFLVYCDPASPLDADDVVFVERQNGTMSLKMFRGKEEGWTILEGWLPPDENGTQKAYTLRERTEHLKRLVPVLYIKRKI